MSTDPVPIGAIGQEAPPENGPPEAEAPSAAVAPDVPEAPDAPDPLKGDETSEAGAMEAPTNEPIPVDDVKRYSKDELLRIRSLPLCLKRPDCLNKPGYNAYGCWAVNKRVSESADDDRQSKDSGGDKRRIGDPRERIRKESEGIVLSPQRRSFNSGCFVMAGHVNNTRLRPDSPMDQKSELGTRESSRRIGSGRILARDIAPPWERSGDIDDSLGNNDYGNIYRAPGTQRERNDRDDRFERRSFGRDMYMNEKNRNDRDRDIGDNRFGDRKDRDDMRRGNRYSNDRRRGYDKDEEPEWFSGGPTSQNETIELRGFDDPATTAASTTVTSLSSTTTNSTNANSNSNVVSTTPMVNANNNSTETSARIRPTRRSAGSGRTPSAIAANQVKEHSEEDNQNKTVPLGNVEKEKSTDDNRLKMDSLLDFNMDDLLKFDFMSGLVTNGGQEDKNLGGSRFSRWFKQESPTNSTQREAADSGMSDHLLKNIMNDLETSISIPNNDSQHVFAPISPAANTAAPQNSLLEILRRGQQQTHQQMSHQQMSMQHHKPIENMPAMKIHSLAELEARMREPMHQNQNQHHQMQRGNMGPHQQPPQNESAAFKRLLEQMSEGQAVSATNGPIPNNSQPQPMSILQMLNKSQQADQAAMEAHHHHQQHHYQQQQQHQQQQHQHHQQQAQPHDLIKMLQVQPPENINKMMQGNMNQMNRHYQVSSPIPNDIPPQTGMPRDVMQRPEAQAILHGLKQGDITIQSLRQQMGNPGIQPRYREVIGTILQTCHQQQATSPRARLVPPQTSQQQLRISPLPPNAYCVSPILATSPNTLSVHHPAIPQRIPSPRELQAHTQCIMQGALIKKKLEEQKENYRRRQEQAGPLSARTTTPAPIVSPTKHPALAFTPTSVLRKMTAEKEIEHVMPKPAVGWGAPPLHAQNAPVPKHARPIVKGNASGMPVAPYQSTTPDYPPGNQFMNHQQQQYANNMQQKQAPSAQPPRNMMGHQSHHQFHAMIMQMHRQQHQQQLQTNNRMPPMQNQMIPPSHRNHNDNLPTMGPSLSPTSNQLARWFSPELLAKASAGKLPSVNMAPNVLSLEELERKQHNEAIVHN